MEVDQQNPTSASNVEASGAIADTEMATTPVPLVVLPVIPPVPPSLVMPPGVLPVPHPAAPFSVLPTVTPLVVPPPIAPLPVVPPSLPRPLAPLPIRPPVLKPPVAQNGEARDPESDDNDEGSKKGADFEITEESREVRERQEKLMRDFMMKRRAAALAVPTNDMLVRTRLRRLGEPITLFGEREMERRDRLRTLMAKLDAEGQLEKLMKAHEEEEAANVKDDVEEETIKYPFYTEGSKELFEARTFIAKFSIQRASQRLQQAKRKRDDPDEDEDAEMDWALNQAGTFSLDASEIGDDRPLSGCSFSKDGNLLATWYVL